MALIEEGQGGSDERVVTVRGEIDVGSAPALRDWLGRASEGGRRSVVVDLRPVRFLAVSALYVLCDEQHRMAAHEARLTIVCADRRVLQMFNVCRLDDVFEIVPSPGDAEPGAWTVEDERRAERLTEWLQRYSVAESA